MDQQQRGTPLAQPQARRSCDTEPQTCILHSALSCPVWQSTVPHVRHPAPDGLAGGTALKTACGTRRTDSVCYGYSRSGARRGPGVLLGPQP